MLIACDEVMLNAIVVRMAAENDLFFMCLPFCCRTDFGKYVDLLSLEQPLIREELVARGLVGIPIHQTLNRPFGCCVI